MSEKNVQLEIEAKVNTFRWVLEHFPQFDVADQMRVINIIFDTFDKLEPFYSKYDKNKPTFFWY